MLSISYISNFVKSNYIPIIIAICILLLIIVYALRKPSDVEIAPPKVMVDSESKFSNVSYDNKNNDTILPTDHKCECSGYYRCNCDK